MANPLKILTVLSASKAVEMEETLKVIGNADFDSQLTASWLKVENSADVDGALDVGGAASLASTLSVTGIADFDSQVTASSLKVENAAEVAGAATFGSTMKVIGNADFDAQVTASLLKVEGAAEIAGAAELGSTLHVVGIADFDSQVTASALKVENAAEVVGAATFGSTMTVIGNADFDAQLTASTAKVEGAAEIAGAAEFGSTMHVVGNADFDAQLTASALKVENDAQIVGDLSVRDIAARSGSFSGDLSVQGNMSVQGNLQVNGALTYINTANLDVTDKQITIAKGSADAAAANGAGILVEGAAASLTYNSTGDKWSFNKDLQLDAGNQMFLSGALFANATVETARDGSGFYDVDDVLHKLASAGSSFQAAYNAARYVEVGSLSSGTATVNITSGAASLLFAVAEKNNIALDVVVSVDDGASWTNDLVAVKLYADGLSLKVQIEAPAMSGEEGAKYRLIAVNEKDLT